MKITTLPILMLFLCHRDSNAKVLQYPFHTHVLKKYPYPDGPVWIPTLIPVALPSKYLYTYLLPAL